LGNIHRAEGGGFKTAREAGRLKNGTLVPARFGCPSAIFLAGMKDQPQ